MNPLLTRFDDQERFKAQVTLVTDSFAVSPSGPITLDLIHVMTDRVFVTPKKSGKLTIALKSEVGPAQEGQRLRADVLAVDIEVTACRSPEPDRQSRQLILWSIARQDS